MTNKLQTLATEQTKPAAAALLRKEIRSFIGRNQIIGKKYCKNCLKAHIIKKAREFGIYEPSLSLIESVTKEEAGHMGYYLDEGILIKI